MCKMFVCFCLRDDDKIRHYQQHIPVTVLGISNKDYPELKLKAWTNRIMSSFLAACLEQACAGFAVDAVPPRLALAAATMKKLSQWLLAVERAPRYLSQQEADHMNNLGNEWLGKSLYCTYPFYS